MSTVIFFLILGFFTSAITTVLTWMIVHGGTRKPTPELPLPNGRIIGGKK